MQQITIRWIASYNRPGYSIFDVLATDLSSLEKDKVNFLLFDSSFGDRIYRNIFHVAVGSGDEKSVQVCLNQDPEIVREYFQSEIKHGDGYLIHSACKNGMEKCLLRIVECMEDSDTLQLNRKDESGFTPIHK